MPCTPPEALPAPLDFGGALALLRRGGTAERPGVVLVLRHGSLHRVLSALGNTAPWVPAERDLLATDWEDRHHKHALVQGYAVALAFGPTGCVGTCATLGLSASGSSAAPVLEALDAAITIATTPEPEPEPETVETLDKARQDAAVAKAHADARWRDAVQRGPSAPPRKAKK